MKTFLAKDVAAEVRRIIVDAAGAKFTDAQLALAINSALKAVIIDAPASRYTSLVAFTDEVTLTITGTSGTTIADTDAVPLDLRWQKAVTHHTAYLLFSQDDRSTVNAEYAKEQYKLYVEAL